MGLEALLGPKIDETPAPAGGPTQPTTLKLTQMQAGKYQPRTRMDEGSLYELAESIRSQGIMQPILVRPLEGAGAKAQRYEIIAGERRFRAAKLAGLDEVPVLVREVPDESAAVMALIENIQREDLNPLEEAQGLKRLVDEFGMTHEAAAQSVGPLAQRGQQPAAPAQSGRAGAADADGGRPRHGPRARAAHAGAGAADPQRDRDRRQEDVGARRREARRAQPGRAAARRRCCA